MQLFQRLRDQDPAVTPALRWLEETLAKQGTTAEEMVRIEHQRQATMNVTVRNVITSMRLISWFDWAEFVESVGLVDEVLRERSAFAEMDFATRDSYRKAIEEMSRGTTMSQIEIARTAADMADAAATRRASRRMAIRRGDPGYFLISEGRTALERALDVRPPLATRLRRAFVRFPSTGYLGTVTLLTLAILAVPLLLLAGDRAAASLVVILAIVPASELAVAIVNRIVTRVVGPRTLPRLELDDGVPPSCARWSSFRCC